MKNANLKLILILVFFFFVILIATFVKYSFKTNPDSAIGNTPGNLYNKGLFCQLDDMVYFSNAYDNNSLYSMHSDETHVKKIADVSPQYINAAGHYLYYFQLSSNTSSSKGLGSFLKLTGIYRSNLNGENIICLSSDLANTLSLAGNYIYSEHYETNGMSLYKTKIDGSKSQCISKTALNPACVFQENLYYAANDNTHYLSCFSLKSETNSTLLESAIYNPIMTSDYVYYMNISDHYCLYRYSFASKSAEPLTTEPIDFFNLYDHVIYYQVRSDKNPCLMRMNLDGSSSEVVKSGVFEKINITSNYVYFSEFGHPVPVYKTSTFGDINVTTFDAAATGLTNS